MRKSVEICGIPIAGELSIIVPPPSRDRSEQPLMTTIVDLTADEIAELLAASKQSDVSEALRTAVREYIRYVRRQELMTLSGRVEIQDNWQELEDAEYD